MGVGVGGLLVLGVMVRRLSAANAIDGLRVERCGGILFMPKPHDVTRESMHALSPMFPWDFQLT
jgi:hypothetical protein|nr:hypothetical protein Q903MT_gene6361 [Picea sitchensis]